MIKNLPFTKRTNVLSAAAVVLFSAISIQGVAQTKLNSLNQARTASWTPTSQDLIPTDNTQGKIDLAMTDVTINQG